MNYISILSTIITFLFAAAVFRRYLTRGGIHLLLWSIGLLFYGLGTLTEVVLSLTFSGAMLKLWYLTGAMLTAAWLGQGTMFLLVRKRGVATGFLIGLAVLSLVSAVLVFTAPLTQAAAAYHTSLPASGQYKDILVRSGAITALTIILNIYGTLTMVGGAIYSAFLFWRKQVLLNRVIGNILIAAGALAPAMGGTFVKAGVGDLLYVSEFIGAILMYIGFLRATYRPAQEPAAQPATQ